MPRQPLVAVYMGSESDWDVVRHAVQTLIVLGIPHEARVVSAHRSPGLLREVALGARGRLDAIIAGAGGAAHLPGMLAAWTRVPVLGVPLESNLLGLDSLLSIMAMPAGVPVATFAVGRAGAVGAALFAARLLAPYHPAIDGNLEAYVASQEDAARRSVLPPD